MGIVRRCCVLAIALAPACGRAGFDAIDAAIDVATDAAPPRFVVATTMENVTAQLVDVPIPAVPAGDLVIVAFASHDGKPVTNVMTSRGTSLVDAQVRAAMQSTASELWYGVATDPIDSVSITMSASSNFDVWVVELGGAAASPAAMASRCLGYPPTVVQAAAAAEAGQLVFGVTMLQYPAFLSTIDPPFTPLKPLTGNGAAYYIAPDAGSFGPQWEVGQGAGMAAMTCASTLVFAPSGP